MLPASLDLVIFRNVTFSVGITCIDINNNPVDITGWVPYAQARDKPAGRLIIDLAPTISGPAVNGLVLISLTSAQTSGLEHGTYVWDFHMKQPNGLIIGPFLAGKFIVNDSVSNP